MSAPSRCLAAGQVLRIENARGVQVTVQSGAVWITEEARNDDVWLRAGEHAALVGPGLALLEAIGSAKVRIS